jgi:hypothetical protein
MRTILVHLNISTEDTKRDPDEIVTSLLRHLGANSAEVVRGRDEFRFENSETTIAIPLIEEV